MPVGERDHNALGCERIEALNRVGHETGLPLLAVGHHRRPLSTGTHALPPCVEAVEPTATPARPRPHGFGITKLPQQFLLLQRHRDTLGVIDRSAVIGGDRDARHSRKPTQTPVKQAVISASALSLLYPADGIEGYARGAFLSDLIDE